MNHNFFAIVLAIYSFLTLLATGQPVEPSNTSAKDESNVFCYFADPNGKDGLRLAASEDGLKWEALNGNKGILQPTIGDKIFRDPCILRGPDGTFHLVWTVSWNGNKIGYSSSKDLITWTPQMELEVMGKTPGVMNCWAPEVIYDIKRGEFLIFWSSSVEGRFPETQAKQDKYNNRIYACTTKDFKSLSEPRLLLNPGYCVIDATILPASGRYVMVFKDETVEPVAKKNFRVAWSNDPQGPYTDISEPFTPPIWVEAPSVLQTGDQYIVYFDAYRAKPHFYGGMSTKDFKSYTDISKTISFPRGTKHGTAFKVPSSLVNELKAHFH